MLTPTARRQEFDPDEYRRAAEEADNLRSFLAEFAAKRAFMRASDPVTPRIRRRLPADAPVIAANRDSAVCGLVNKAVNTHASVRLLADNGNGDDAMALGRVLLENSVILRWLLLDPIYRLDLYCIANSMLQRHWRTLAEEHFREGHPEVADRAQREVSDDVLSVAEFFGDTIHKWAQVEEKNGRLEAWTVEKMMKELVKADGTTSKNFQYDVIYFLHSSWVHSTPTALRTFNALNGLRYFTCELGANRAWCASALGGANIFLLQTLQAACNYLGFHDLDANLDVFFQNMQTSRAR